MKIGVKLTLTFFSVAFISMLVIGIISYRKGKQSLEEESFNRLTAVREMKANQIEDYFSQIRDQVIGFSHDPTVIRAMKRFKKGFDEYKEDETKEAKKAAVADYIKKEFLPRLNSNSDKHIGLEEELCKNEKGILLQYDYIVANPNPPGKKQEMLSTADTVGYAKTHKRFHPFFKDYQERYGFYDIFLIDNKTGNIVYTVFKEVDFATSLHNGPFKNTNLADAFRHADYSDKKDQVQFEDFKPYHPSYNSPASFIAAPIIDSGKKIGVLVFQMPIDRINDIMTSKHHWEDMGLGKSGETYIAGGDYTLRSQSRFFIEDSTGYFAMLKEIGTPEVTIHKMRNFKSTIGLQEVKTEGTIAALEGKSDTRIFNDYRNLPVLSSYKPLKIEGMKWAIMSELDEAEAFAHVYSLRRQIIIFSVAMVLLIFVASFIISRQITKPIKELTNDAKELRKGNFNVEININQKDEIGELAQSFRKMQQSMRKLIYDLKDINHNLEEKVNERTKEIQLQKEIVEHKNKEVVDSINYAKRLQQAILPPLSFVDQHLPSSFIFYKPKDIVAGDFYWVEISPAEAGGEEILVAAADCTGHGVPGAMVSVVGVNGLERCVKEFKLHKPSDILDKLTDLVIATFETSDHEVKDGMDISLVALDRKNKKLQYAGANNPLWIVRNGAEGLELLETKADKQPIGKFDYRKPFTNHTIQLEEGDCVYMFTDGYADQFGGPQGKKFKYKTLKDLLLSMYDKNMQIQMALIEEAFLEWKEGYDQIDDVCLIGFRV
ncbi:MAG: SpoIIE family protein phosphatase [Bacteroidota bacterium]|nr:SpoIIE family protein phosphatase [Bacteroidota bacterium]